MTWAVVDIETTTYTSFKRKANPFDPNNWVVMAGWCTKTSPKPQARRFRAKAEGATHQGHGWFIDLLANGTKLIVGANIKFDLLHILRDPHALEAWMDYVAKGGNVWDIQLAEYLMDGQVQASHMLSLDDMAMRYGFDVKVDEVKKLWEAGVPTEDIDPELLARYLIGEDLLDPVTRKPTGRRREGDIGNTRDIFLKQVEKAKAQGMSRVILANMGSLLCSIEMERNGMYVDQELGHKLAADLEVQLAAAKQELTQYIPDLPFEFSWSNRYHTSPIIFGGTVKYSEYEYDLAAGGTITKAAYDWQCENRADTGNPPKLTYPQKDKLHYVLEDGSTYDCDTYEVALISDKEAPPARAAFKGGKNAGEYKTKKVKVPDYDKAPKGRSVDKYYTFPGYTQPDKEWASSTPGLYSVAADVIEELGNRKDVPFLQALSRVVKLSKDLGTYFITTDEKTGQQTGMLTLVQPDSIIHHMLNHTSTVTGRFSSSNPNLQNIPKGNKSAVKEVFVSRFPSGAIVQSDFSSLEVYVQAILTSCKLLIEDLKSGIDLHVLRLALKEHMDYQEVFKLCKGYTDKAGVKHDAMPEWDYKRTGAKVFSFQRAYGAGVKKIASSTGMAIAEVEALVEAEVKRWPEIDTYFARRTEEIKRNRKLTNITVPHPLNHAIMCQLGSSRVRTPDGTVYSYRETTSPEYLLKKGILASFSPTEIKNYEVQGSGGLWMKVAMWLMVRAWYTRRNMDGQSLLVNTVHDAAYSDSAPDVKHEAAALMHACMTGASDMIEYWFNWKLPLPVPSDTVWGSSMAEEIKFDSAEFKTRSSELRAALRRDYMGGYTPTYLN